MNRTRYVVDPRNYGVPDYWATPQQFLRRDGDCEDYAITKYLSLRALGVPSSEMRILVVQDLNLRLAHAILIVYHNGRALILGNQIKSVVDTSVVRHYKPIYPINENFWWLHRT
jgi:predicted transglutaminase-like cysteine proteinase